MFSAECLECKKIYHGWSLKYASERICPVCGNQLIPKEETLWKPENGVDDANGPVSNK